MQLRAVAACRSSIPYLIQQRAVAAYRRRYAGGVDGSGMGASQTLWGAVCSLLAGLVSQPALKSRVQSQLPLRLKVNCQLSKVNSHVSSVNALESLRTCAKSTLSHTNISQLVDAQTRALRAY
eukprot:3571420-Rhodomonas_salina.1